MRGKQSTQQPDVGFENLNGGVFVEMNDVYHALNGKFKFTVVSNDGQRRQRIDESKAIVSC